MPQLGRQLKGKLEDIGEKAWPWYVLQQEVWPPLLLHGRKFVLRAHVLLHRELGETPRVYLHSSPVVMEHDQPFDFGAASDSREVLVLQHAVKRAERPKPYIPAERCTSAVLHKSAWCVVRVTLES